MSLLTPLFLAGLGALALPVVFHLIRRTPRGRQIFSSLMFLEPSPPRLTRRSRLDNLLLLLLRGLALILIALAFARPFLRQVASLSLENISARRLVILLDTSASMQRTDVWKKAREAVESELKTLEAGDDVSLMAFDKQTRVLVGFEEQGVVPTVEQKSALVRQQLEETNPGWGPTDLGLALVTAADALGATSDSPNANLKTQIVLVSDIQQGARLDSLQAYEWPPEISLSIREVGPRRAGNASIRILAGEEETPDPLEARVRITNFENASTDQFSISWAGGSAGRKDSKPMSVYVPAGESRVVRLKREPPELAASDSPQEQVDKPEPIPAEDSPSENNAPQHGPSGADTPATPAESSVAASPPHQAAFQHTAADRVLLEGDVASFDNQYFDVPLAKREVTIAYVGDETPRQATPDGQLYYLQLATEDSILRTTRLIVWEGTVDAWERDPEPEFVLVTRSLSGEQKQALVQFVEQGGHALFVLQTKSMVDDMGGFGQTLVLEDAPQTESESDYVMVSEIDFRHPLFQPFAKPQYGDFTKIYFWQYRRIRIENEQDVQVLARFDSGAPYLWEQRVGEGRIYAMSSGWNPTASQLARSTKFVPLINGLLDLAAGSVDRLPQYRVYDDVPVPALYQSNPRVVKPDGSKINLDEGFDGSWVDQPGIYRWQTAGTGQSFAVNLAVSESDTIPLERERFEQFQIPLGEQPTQAQQREYERQQSDIELEKRQKIWRWLLVAALAILIGETWLSGRTARRAVSPGQQD